mmetsp:Transcript_21734/g.69990  ORF Transcript_21734/g.69990 Transcript_21734/m.69990 type:complete len:243 (+) Transcript_21734:541-1269(+)
MVAGQEDWAHKISSSSDPVGSGGFDDVPHVEGADGAPWLPGFGDALHVGPGRKLVDGGGAGLGLIRGVELLEALLDGEIADGEDVRPAKGEHAKHMAGPLADAVDLPQCLDDGVVVEGGEDGVRQSALGVEPRKIPDVVGLGPREADEAPRGLLRQELGLVDGDHRVRRKVVVAAADFDQPAEDRLGRRHGDLLVDDRLAEGPPRHRRIRVRLEVHRGNRLEHRRRRTDLRHQSRQLRVRAT